MHGLKTGILVQTKFASGNGTRGANRSSPLSSAGSRQRVQVAGVVELFGSVQSGPNPVLASGTLSMAKGPALCSPLNGVGLVGSNWHVGRAAASSGLSNQKPRWNVLVGAKRTSGSNPKMSSKRIALIWTWPSSVALPILISD